MHPGDRKNGGGLMPDDDYKAAEQYRASAAALLRKPDHPDVLIGHFALLYNTVDRRKVAQLFPLAARAWRLDPEKYTVMFNYATALTAVGRWPEAIAIFNRCVEQAPDQDWLGRACHHLGMSFRSNGDNAEACTWYSKAIDLTGDPEIKKDLALTQLAMGHLNEGLRTFECRRECSEAGIKKHGPKGHGLLPSNVREKHWQGEQLTGKTVVVYHEEGIGDFFMMCRFIPRLRDYGAARILLTGKVPDVLELVADNIAVDGIVPLAEFDCDHVVGSMTVPWRTGVDYDDVDGKPYFKAEPANFPRRGVLNVGLVWRGNPVYGRNSHRSMDFVNFCPLFDSPGIAFYSLQVGDGADEIAAAGYDGFVADLAPFAKSWRQTARLIARLDAVVTVDTACAHLAGALGVPVMMLATKFCDWRWNRQSEHTVWYDAMRVLRQQTVDDWAPLIDDVKVRLETMADGRRQVAQTDPARKSSAGDVREHAVHR
jgi:hypothetical protein